MNKLTLAEYFRLRTPATQTILAGCALLASVGAPAQDAQSSRSFLEEILVTAQKRSESVQDVPITMQAYTGDALAEGQSIGEITDIVKLAKPQPERGRAERPEPAHRHSRRRHE